MKYLRREWRARMDGDIFCGAVPIAEQCPRRYAILGYPGPGHVGCALPNGPIVTHFRPRRHRLTAHDYRH